MLTITLKQLLKVLPALLGARASILLLGAPGGGKTYNSKQVAKLCGPCVTMNGGDENEWRSLFPFKTPSGKIELGKAMIAAGYTLDDKGEPVLTRPGGGTLVLDEFNRCPAELCTQFQLLGSEKKVTWPGTDREIELDLCFIGTGNDADLGVEESARALLDRFDIVLYLKPTSDEKKEIISHTFPVPDEGHVRAEFRKAYGAQPLTAEAAEVVVETVDAQLVPKLDPKKFHLPEGIRIAKAVTRVLKANVFTPAEAFRGCAERCYPLGRRGAQNLRTEFDNILRDVSTVFAGKIHGLVTFVAAPVAAAPVVTAAPVNSLADLLTAVENATTAQVSSPSLPLTVSFADFRTVDAFRSSFGLGTLNYILTCMRNKAEQALVNNIELRFAKSDKPATIKFTNADRGKVMRFCRLYSQLS